MDDTKKGWREMRQFYVQLYQDENEKVKNRVTDIIEYPYEDYVPVKLHTPLPIGSYGGQYELVMNEDGETGKLVYRADWIDML